MAIPFQTNIHCIICQHSAEPQKGDLSQKDGCSAFICPACQAKIFYEAKQSLK